MTVFRTLDTSLNPIAGVKVTLFEIHENGLYYVYIKKDSAISNQMGYTSFDGLSQDYSYRPFASKDCFNSEMMPNIFKMKIQPNRIDTFDIYLTQTGYLKLFNPNTFKIRVWTQKFYLSAFDIPANSNRVLFLPTNPDTIYFAKWKATFPDYYEPPIHDTLTMLTCNDTTSISLQL